jgi:hypothetical protein
MKNMIITKISKSEVERFFSYLASCARKLAWELLLFYSFRLPNIAFDSQIFNFSELYRLDKRFPNTVVFGDSQIDLQIPESTKYGR